MQRPIIVAVAALCLAGAAGPAQGARRMSSSLSFFSSGGGAHADWLHTEDQPAGDTDQQAFRVVDTTTGYAGADVKHAEGLPVEEYPPSSFDFKASQPGPSLGYPRLLYLFDDGGNAYLRPLTWSTSWQTVSDDNWDSNGGTCLFQYQKTWEDVQACHAGAIVTQIVFVTDPGINVTFLVDNLDTAGKVISNAGDNAR
jgi:hypothetical protein